MWKKEIVSIIIPVYNSEKYIDQCLNSVVNQTYKNLQIIAIDDGSTDNSRDILVRWSKIDSRIEVIRKANRGGVSESRNIGIESSRGEFITFIDSDDWIKSNYIEVLINGILNSKSDIIACNFTEECEKNLIERKYVQITEEKQINDIEEAFSDCLDVCSWTLTVWGKLFKKDIIDGIRFSDMPFSEDNSFMYELLEQSPKVQLILYNGYTYHVNSQSVTNDKRRDIERNSYNLLTYWNLWKKCKVLKINHSYLELEWVIIWKVLSVCLGDLDRESKWIVLGRLFNTNFYYFLQFSSKEKIIRLILGICESLSEFSNNRV